MIRKIVILSLIAAFVAIAAEAMSQNTGDSAKSPPPTSSLPEKVLDPVPTVKKPEVGGQKSGVDGQKSDVVGPKTEFGSKPAATPSVKSEKTETGVKSKDAPTGKDAKSSKTFPTSSSTSMLPSASRKELVIERCLVTIIDDNKVPASEAGMLTAVPVKEGHSVDKDQMVAEIDTRSTVAKQRIAQAEHEAAMAQAANDAEVEVAEKAIEVSKADLDANVEIRRRNPQAVSESEHRKYVFTYEKSLAQRKQALNEKEIARLTANAKQAQFDAASIEIDLRQARSPFKGVVVEVMKKVGDWVTVGEPIMHIVGLDKVQVKGFVRVSGEDGASHDEVIGKPVKIVVDGAGGKKHTVNGVIGFASPVIEGVGTSRQFRIWADVDNEHIIDPVTKQESWKIQPGSVATMTIDLTPPRPAFSPLPTKTDSSKGFKGKVDAYKPVTSESEKAGEKKAKRER